MTKRILIALSTFFLSLLFSYAQTEILPLYPDGKIPLAKACSLIEVFDTTEDGRPNFHKNITKPELYNWKTYKPNPKRNAVLVIPGGSYSFVSMENEGRKVAERLASEGFEVFVLKYRLPNPECVLHKEWVPLTDAMNALERIRKLGFLNVGVIGFSAGGHLAGSLMLLSKRNPYAAPIEPPTYTCLLYPAISFYNYPDMGSRKNLLGPNPVDSIVQRFSLEKQIVKKVPPILLIHSIDDEIVAYQNSELLFGELIKQKSHAEIHLFPLGGHGYGIGSVEKKEAPNWLPLFLDFAARTYKP